MVWMKPQPGSAAQHYACHQPLGHITLRSTMPFSWRPRERTRLTCSTGGDVVADIGCRRDVLTCPIVSALPVLPLPPPALPNGSNGASPASTWPIPQTERRPQSIVLRFFRNPQQDGACARSRNGGNAPCLMGICAHHALCSSRSLGPRQAVVRTLICPSTHIGFASLQTRFHLKPANQ
jgi:hypothetical protein